MLMYMSSLSLIHQVHYYVHTSRDSHSVYLQTQLHKTVSNSAQHSVAGQPAVHVQRARHMNPLYSVLAW